MRPSIHSAEASCTPGDRPRWWCWLKSGRAGRERGGVGAGRAEWKGSQASPSGSAQPAHSSSFSTGASAGMSPHVRDHCLEAGLLVWLKRPFRSINTDESQMCCPVPQSDAVPDTQQHPLTCPSFKEQTDSVSIARMSLGFAGGDFWYFRIFLYFATLSNIFWVNFCSRHQPFSEFLTLTQSRRRIIPRITKLWVAQSVCCTGQCDLIVPPVFCVLLSSLETLRFVTCKSSELHPELWNHRLSVSRAVSNFPSLVFVQPAVQMSCVLLPDIRRRR